MQRKNIYTIFIVVLCGAPLNMYSMQTVRRLGSSVRAFAACAKSFFPQWVSRFNSSKNSTMPSTSLARLRSFIKQENTYNKKNEGYKQNFYSHNKNGHRSWNNWAQYGAQLLGASGMARWFWATYNEDKDNPAFTIKNIDTCPEHKRAFIHYAIDNICTNDKTVATAIVYLMKKYPESVPLICTEILKYFDGIRCPSLIAGVIEFNKNVDFVGSLIKTAFDHRKTETFETALCIGMVIDAFPSITPKVELLVRQEFNQIHGCVLAALLRNHLQFARNVMPWILNTDVLRLKRLLSYESFIQCKELPLQQLILKSVFQGTAWMSPENLSLVYMFMGRSEAAKLKQATLARFNSQQEAALPAHAIYALYNKSYLFEPLSKPIYEYADFDIYKQYTKQELFDATMRDVAVVGVPTLEKIYAEFHINKIDPIDQKRSHTLRAAYLQACINKNAQQANMFIEIVRGTLSHHDQQLFQANKPYFVGDIRYWIRETIQKIALDNVHLLSAQNMDHVFYNIAHSSQEKTMVRNAALCRFGKIERVNVTPNLLVCLYRKKFDNYKVPGFLIEEFINKQYSKQEVIEAVIKNPRMVSIDNLNYVYYRLMDNNNDRDQLKQAASSIYGTEKIQLSKEILTSGKQINKPAFLYDCVFSGQKPSQTEQHFSANLVRIFHMMQRHKTVDNPLAKEMLLDAHRKELEEMQKGNHVFYHGSQWQWDFIRRMDKFGYNLMARPQDRLDEHYARFRFDDSDTDGLCMNYALFGNANDDTSGTASYVLRNHDYSTAERMRAFATERLLERHNLGHIYHRYKNEFDVLEQLHKEANPGNIGSLIVLSIPDKDVHHVFPAPSAGMGRKVRPIMVNGKYTTDIRTILHALTTNPQSIQHGESDLIEFAMRLNKDYTLNPKSSLRMFSFGAVDKNKWNEYKRRESELFARLEQEVGKK